MKSRFALLLVCTLLVTIAACSTAASNKENAAPSASASSPAATSSPSAETKETPNPVNARYLSVNLPADWTSLNGEESFGFQRDGVPIGGLDGLGYSDTIDGLLPNGANVDSKEELTGLPVKTVMAKLSMDDGGSAGKRQEYHFYFFLQEKNVVYDLRFDAGLVKESDSRAIAMSVTVK
ncbi:hypothetical protein E5161_11495 [Cohnella pontilimi]|uniref:Uncharacterized protein n=1 Tax=Cohnella pontilimi TaxID=2564100 RepID=A0A4U0FAW1_9BACL|nr:hypothetical protein [Cohnella pontilimi]TJY41820.1 hypothetical protein E5161_11495 [Cohnella pontilimi]